MGPEQKKIPLHEDRSIPKPPTPLEEIASSLDTIIENQNLLQRPTPGQPTIITDNSSFVLSAGLKRQKKRVFYVKELRIKLPGEGDETTGVLTWRGSWPSVHEIRYREYKGGFNEDKESEESQLTPLAKQAFDGVGKRIKATQLKRMVAWGAI